MAHAFTNTWVRLSDVQCGEWIVWDGRVVMVGPKVLSVTATGGVAIIIGSNIEQVDPNHYVTRVNVVVTL